MDLGVPSTFSETSLAYRRGAPAVIEDNASRLHSAFFPESLKQKGFCVVKGALAARRPPSFLGSMQLFKVSEKGLWYSSRVDDMMQSLSSLSLIRHSSHEPE